ncbi:Signal-peptide peptidase, presenilin aspartyl protease [uncultured archaeon]|nr:Signal-peptide peptidase, presenilin aspartyl protease [uncultured archaeon]
MKVVQVFAYLLLLFTLTQVLGFYAGTFITQDAKGNQVIQGLQVVSQPSEPASVGYLFFYVLLGAAFMYLLVKYYKGEFLFMLIEFGVVSFASSIVFYSLIKPFLSDTLLSIAISVALGLALGLLKAALPQLKNFAAVMATAGAGAVFGFSLTFYMGLFFMVLLSIYDYIAVFKTKHMVTMAKTLSKREMSFMVTSRQKTEKGEIRLELGTGDMLMPVILETSGFQISPAYAAVVFLASVFSLFVLFVLLTRKKAVLPALPIIAACNFIFLGAAKLLGMI